ncbi:hypothetical protein [Streptomyces albipurpureus]|uniref:Uncharacterized protein n=1 Tax=Streptomyces albipurpureus TaxID=2897419 RepID=A0ABT0UVJ4_9ACTN|nr:hypothetical protein [Streptomyces sp. CWNU-1]MCM2392593.1 hypothetical protein [Streptomyces sp. CWNU-1]
MSKGAAMTAGSWVLSAGSRTKHRSPCGCWSSGERPCWVDEWAAERVGPATSEAWTFVVELDGGQWRARRKPDGSLEYTHTGF